MTPPQRRQRDKNIFQTPTLSGERVHLKLIVWFDRATVLPVCGTGPNKTESHDVSFSPDRTILLMKKGLGIWTTITSALLQRVGYVDLQCTGGLESCSSNHHKIQHQFEINSDGK